MVFLGWISVKGEFWRGIKSGASKFGGARVKYIGMHKRDANDLTGEYRRVKPLRMGERSLRAHN